jgi:hypothetical protein
MWIDRYLSILRWCITRWGMRWYHVEIMVIFILESPVFITIIFLVVTTTTPITITYICTYLTFVKITTTVTQIRPTYFSIRVNTIKYSNIWILTKFTERIWVIMQFFMDLFPCPLEDCIGKSGCRPFEKSIIKFTEVLKWKVLLTPLQRGRLEWYTNTVCHPQTDSRSYITIIKHVAD